MFRRSLPALILLAALVAPATSAEPAKSAESPAPTNWKDDPVCRMVFFAVLEGLYEDGVPDAVVDSVVPRHPKEGTNPVKTSFVIQCPLCHAVYEAFAAYQKRPAFNDDPKRNTFGKGLEAKMMKELTDPKPSVRLTALSVLVHQWVERKMNAMRLTEAEKQEWTAKLHQRSDEGRNRLSELMENDPNYKGWSIYWGCAACNGTTAACSDVRVGGKK